MCFSFHPPENSNEEHQSKRQSDSLPLCDVKLNKIISNYNNSEVKWCTVALNNDKQQQKEKKLKNDNGVVASGSGGGVEKSVVSGVFHQQRLLNLMKLLRRFKQSGGWIIALLEEAENERIHLMTFLKVAKTKWYERALVFKVQCVFFNVYFVTYILSHKLAHRIVGTWKKKISILTLSSSRNWAMVTLKISLLLLLPLITGTCLSTSLSAILSWLLGLMRLITIMSTTLLLIVISRTTTDGLTCTTWFLFLSPTTRSRVFTKLHSTVAFASDSTALKLVNHKRIHTDITDDIKNSFGVDINYQKAWRSKEHAVEMLKGFRRPVVIVDAVHLSGAYKGTFVSASIIDSAGCILSFVYDIVDTETDNS
ncbi:hypothetical protein FXO38_21126 [Capsicum annuum]|nr:hypothetical protein FXO38_21126 [Capsicum annuum]